MTPEAFRRIAVAVGLDPKGQTHRACKAVLVEGLTAAGAARACQISEAAVSRALTRCNAVTPAAVCPRCLHRL